MRYGTPPMQAVALSLCGCCVYKAGGQLPRQTFLVSIEQPPQPGRRSVNELSAPCDKTCHATQRQAGGSHLQTVRAQVQGRARVYKPKTNDNFRLSEKLNEEAAVGSRSNRCLCCAASPSR